MAFDAVIRTDRFDDKYDIQNELGRGHFAVVKKCVCKKTNNEVAAKFIHINRTKESKKGVSREMVEREANILNLLDHEKVIKLYDVFDMGSEMCLVLEILTGGELFDKLCEEDYFTEMEAGLFMRQVVDAMFHLHQNNIVHLDIKPENIVLKCNKSTDIKLVDFGLAKYIKLGEEVRETMGTAEFVAPEIINHKPIGFFTDMWAVGVLAFILLSGDSPFLGDNNTETFKHIVNVNYQFVDEEWHDISEEAKQFVEQLLVKQTSERKTAQDCKNSKWLRSLMLECKDAEQTIIHTTKLKAFVARRKWAISMQKMKAVSAFQKSISISDND